MERFLIPAMAWAIYQVRQLFAEVCLLPYLLLSAAQVTWAFLLLRTRPVREYAGLFFFAGSLGIVAECGLLILLLPFMLRGGFRADPYQDLHMTEVVTKFGIFPVQALLFTHYARTRPLLKAIIGGAALGLLELLFLRLGAMHYHRWSPVYTAILYTGFFLIAWAIARRRAPAWLHIWAIAFYLQYNAMELLMGGLGLWHHPIPGLVPLVADTLFALLHGGLIVAPVITLFCLHPQLRHGWGIVACVLVLLLVEQLTLMAGLTLYMKWNLTLSALRYLVAVAVPYWYAAWLLEDPRERLLT